MSEHDSGNGEWYISGAHGRRALGYLGVSLVEQGHLASDFEQPILLDIWAEALEKTMLPEDNPPSPIGAPSS